MLPTIVIKPQDTMFKIPIKELWDYRQLFFIFAWRDIKVRYKQTFLGVAWALIQPVVSTFIFTLFFGQLAKIPSGDLPYPLFVIIGLVFWGFFSNSLNTASNSLVASEHIIKKIYFPRIILPLATIVTGMIDFMISFALVIILGFYYGYVPRIIDLPIIVGVVFFTSIAAGGIGLFFAALNVKYRDVRYVLPFIFQTLMFLTPVIYSLEIGSPSNQLIMAINPMTTVIEIVRHVFAGNTVLNPLPILISLVSTCFFIVIGIWYFNKTEKLFADLA